MHVTVQVFAFKEPHLTRTLDAWEHQDVPRNVDVSYEAWITPAKNRETWEQAVDHPTFEAHEAPKYKLRSRNAAHERAVSTGADVFIAADADAPPLNRNVLSALSRTIRKRDVEAAVSNPVAPVTPTGIVSNAGVRVKEAAGGIHGQCHALTVASWDACGPFSEDVDHTSLQSVWLEEELSFGRRLRRFGNVEVVKDARVFNDTRRRDCRWRRSARREDGEFCGRAGGAETFAPRKPF